jgi:hypothetical protein
MTRLERVHAALYAALICVFVASGALFTSQFLTNSIFWERFTLAYLGVLIVYTWYLFGLLLVHDVRPRRYPKYDGGKIAVMIPCYNEDPQLVEDSIRSVLAAYGNKQIIVIDDGSTNGVQTRLRELEYELPIVTRCWRRTHSSASSSRLARPTSVPQPETFCCSMSARTS